MTIRGRGIRSDLVQGGSDPAGVIFDPDREAVKIPSGNCYR